MHKLNLTKNEKLSWDYIKQYYSLDFLVPGQHVIVGKKHGTVIGAQNQYLVIHIPTPGKPYDVGNYHPTSNLAFLDVDGKIIKDFRE